MSIWKNDKKRISREQLVGDVIRYCEDANRDVDTASLTETFEIRGYMYTVNISCSVRKVER